jgi:hypothetical protein
MPAAITQLGRVRSRLRKVRSVRAVALACAAVLAAPALAWGYNEYYGGTLTPSNNSYVQSSGAHTFVYNQGSTVSTLTYIACQLFASGGPNVVSHGTQNCSVPLPAGSGYVWARIYNQTDNGLADYLYGWATT